MTDRELLELAAKAAGIKKDDSPHNGGSHYISKNIQPWAAMEAWMTKEEFQGFLRGNAIKYLARCNDKGGLQDVLKARHYIDKLAEVLNATNKIAE